MRKPDKNAKYECSKGCGAKRSSWSAIRTHETACNGKPSGLRKVRKKGGER